MLKLTPIIALSLALLGCASPAYNSLRSEQDLPHLKALLDEAPPMTRTDVITKGAHGRDLAVAVWTEAEDQDELIILLHGVLSDSRAWRYISGDLARRADLLMVDLPGAGASQALPPFVLKRDDKTGYSTPALASRTAEAIDDAVRARRTPPTRITIVAHSLGSLVTMRMLADDAIAPDHRDWMADVDRIAMISPIDPAMPYGPPSLEAVATISWIKVELGEMTGILREKIARGSKQSFVNGHDVPREQVDALYGIVADNHKRTVAQDMLKTVIPMVEIDGVFYPDWARTETFIQDVRRYGEQANIQWLLIVGERDEVAPASMAYHLAAQFADADVVAIAETKHSPHLERPAITAAILNTFLDGGDPTGDQRILNEERIIPE